MKTIFTLLFDLSSYELTTKNYHQAKPHGFTLVDRFKLKIKPLRNVITIIFQTIGFGIIAQTYSASEFYDSNSDKLNKIYNCSWNSEEVLISEAEFNANLIRMEYKIKMLNELGNYYDYDFQGNVILSEPIKYMNHYLVAYENQTVGKELMIFGGDGFFPTDLNVGAESSNPRHIKVMGQEYYFIGYMNGHDNVIRYNSNGFEPIVEESSLNEIINYFVINDLLFYHTRTATDDLLYVKDLSIPTALPILIKSEPFSVLFSETFWSQIIEFNGTYYFYEGKSLSNGIGVEIGLFSTSDFQTLSQPLPSYQTVHGNIYRMYEKVNSILFVHDGKLVESLDGVTFSEIYNDSSVNIRGFFEFENERYALGRDIYDDSGRIIKLETGNNIELYTATRIGLSLLNDSVCYLGAINWDPNLSSKILKIENGMLIEIPISESGKGVRSSVLWNSIFTFLYANELNGEYAIDVYQLNQTVGVPELNSTMANFKLYPNPISNDELLIIDGVVGESIELIDCSGRMIETFSVVTNKAVIQLKNRDPGVYYIRINGAVEKLIIQ